MIIWNYLTGKIYLNLDSNHPTEMTLFEKYPWMLETLDEYRQNIFLYIAQHNGLDGIARIWQVLEYAELEEYDIAADKLLEHPWIDPYYKELAQLLRVGGGTPAIKDSGGMVTL